MPTKSEGTYGVLKKRTDPVEAAWEHCKIGGRTGAVLFFNTPLGHDLSDEGRFQELRAELSAGITLQPWI